MKKLNYFIVTMGFLALTIISNHSLEAETAGQKLDKGIEKTEDAYENAKESLKDTYDDTIERVQDTYNHTKVKAKVKYNESLENAKVK